MSARAKTSSPAPPTGRRLLRTGMVLAVLLALAVYLAVHRGHEGRDAGSGCTVVSGEKDGSEFRFSPEQAVNAATISVVGTSRGMPEQAVTIALATALQESGLRNLDHGDRDSLGLFQQRPSQGWGTAEQVMDPVYAAGRFYEHLAKVPGYTRLPLTVAAQRVQRSGYPDAYAKHEPDATLLAAAFTGRAAATLTCAGDTGAGAGDPAKVRSALIHDFGAEVLTAKRSAPAMDGGAAEGVRPARARAGATAAGRTGPKSQRSSQEPSQEPAGPESSWAEPAEAEGPLVTARGSDARTVTVPVRAADTPLHRDADQRGWELAHWAVAHASVLRIERVGYADREWTAGSSAAWRDAGRRGADGEGSAGESAQAPGEDRVLIVTAG